MFKRKLRALNCYVSDDFDATDVGQYRGLIAWLEDQKIRHYKIEDRDSLRHIESNSWPKHFVEYLIDLDCPFKAEQNSIVLDWILTLAVKLDYEDNSEKYKAVTAESVKKASIEPQLLQSNPLDKLDFDGKEFKEGVTQLAAMLRVPEQPVDHLSTLKAISYLIRNKMVSSQSQPIGNKCGPTDRPTASVRQQIEDSNLGFHINDKVLNNCAKVLRLLYINDLRELQTKINELIVSVQSITANPVTDTKLGTVGR